MTADGPGGAGAESASSPSAADSNAKAPGRINHRLARERWGEPDDWEGSVNDPRTREENGIRYNEKWVYFLPRNRRRIVYWHRYGFRGVVCVEPDGTVGEESF